MFNFKQNRAMNMKVVDKSKKQKTKKQTKTKIQKIYNAPFHSIGAVYIYYTYTFDFHSNSL